MVKLQRHKAYVYTSGAGVDIEHYKHLITVPEDLIQEMGWKEGQELNWVVDGDAAKLEPRTTKKGKK